MKNLNNLIKEINKLKKTGIKELVDKRIKEFEVLNKKSNNAWFSELCFCLLTANSKAKTAIQIQKDLGIKGFISAPENTIRQCIIDNKHRFHNNKTKYILEARKYINIKEIIKNKKDEFEARQWLVDNIKGLGFKESSHFLRNIGYKNLAILDRHIQNLMVDNKLLSKKPQSLNKKTYIELEEKLKILCEKLNLNQAELDLYMWYIKTNEILK